MKYEITHLPEESKFVAQVDGETGYVEYAIYEDYLNIAHTHVPREVGGRGLASLCRIMVEKASGVFEVKQLWLIIKVKK